MGPAPPATTEAGHKTEAPDRASSAASLELVAALAFCSEGPNDDGPNPNPPQRQEAAQRMGRHDDPPILLEGAGWKRRSGFGRYSDTVGGTSWERRRFALTPTQLRYYAACEVDSTKSLAELTPRGTLDILPERATITATYPGDTSQPAPYALTVKVADAAGLSDTIKWKLCFDDRETQLIWLVALTDIVADASVKEYNANVLSSEAHKVQHGGFHRLYEEGDGRLLDVVHAALLSGGEGRRGKGAREGSAKQMEGILSAPSRDSSVTISPVSAAPGGAAFFDGADRKEKELPMDKLYQAVGVVLLSFAYERWSGADFISLWQLFNIAILYICFWPKAEEKTGRDRQQKSPTKKMVVKDEQESLSPLQPVTRSAIGAELMRAEGVPLSGMPSTRFPTKKQSDKNATHRLEPLTEDEMGAHLHERWAQSAPNVDLSGEWTLIADDAFKAEYDAYLKQLGFSGITRKVACSLIARTTEITKQSDNGRELYLKGTNPKGAWERTLSSSGYPDFETHSERREGEDYSHMKTSIKTADSEDVDAEAWWEERGSKHRSWLRGGKKYGGGDFESLRYLEDGSDGSVLVCESIFHPLDPSKKRAAVTWRFQRNDVTSKQ
ncbi:hypothetical protein ACHAXT_000668 [Thalassiosira profunda]